MSNLDLVRADIKAWERDFASRHGRDPSVRDIRDQPSIAEKYKLYKKLSKSLPQARPPDSVPPLPGFNPFSPVKKAASLRQPASQTSRSSPHPNPFATPTKNTKPTARAVTASPEPSTSSCALPVPSAAVSRARKRLRGEPVSPSPSKPKRQRIRSQALPPFHTLERDSSNSEHEADQELPHCDFASSFVADSPVKAPAGGKSFKLLFDDALPALSIPKRFVGSSRAQPNPPSNTKFAQSSANLPFATSHNLCHKLASRSGVSGPIHRGSLSTTAISRATQPRASMKRTLDSSDTVHESTEVNAPVQAQYPLVPPSPPPQDSINRDSGKRKTKTTASRKRLKVGNEDDDEGADSSDDVTLRVTTIGLNRDKRSRRETDEIDWDPLLHLATHDHAAMQQHDANHHVSGTFSVDLPEKFRRVLAISPSRIQNRTEEHVVRGLLYGDRVGHYDPSRGGVIWGAGEADDNATGGIDTEDDWEGEPVPWEVGEL